jgi:L,D-transpeptidase YcbB
MGLKIKQYFVWISLLLAIVACQRKLTRSNISVTVNAAPEAKVELAPIKIPEAFESAAYQGIRFPSDVFVFYKHHGFEPFWLENNVRSPRADSMIMVIQSARRYGLLPQHYHFHEIPELVLEPMDSSKMARLDILLTDAFLSMASDLKRGRVNKKIVTADSTQIALLTVSLKARDINEVLSSQEPTYEGYRVLKWALNNMLDTLDTIEQNLLLYGNTSDSIDSHRKIQRIEINLERWRNEIEQLDNIYTWNNIPEFLFYLF